MPFHYPPPAADPGPSGPSEADVTLSKMGRAAASYNRTGSTFSTALQNFTYVQYPGNFIVCPPTDRWTRISYQLLLAYTNSGAATIYANLYDILKSSSVSADADTCVVQTNDVLPVGGFLKGEYLLEPHVNWRPFSLLVYFGKVNGGDSRIASINHVDAEYSSKMEAVIL